MWSLLIQTIGTIQWIISIQSGLHFHNNILTQGTAPQKILHSGSSLADLAILSYIWCVSKNYYNMWRLWTNTGISEFLFERCWWQVMPMTEQPKLSTAKGRFQTSICRAWQIGVQHWSSSKQWWSSRIHDRAQAWSVWVHRGLAIYNTTWTKTRFTGSSYFTWDTSKPAASRKSSQINGNRTDCTKIYPGQIPVRSPTDNLQLCWSK